MSALEHGVVGFITLLVIVAAWLWVGRRQDRYRRLIAVTALLTFVLIALGAYVRLSDAGLGCPDWPGCYGNLTPHHSTQEIRAAEASVPGGPVTMGKAWKEMAHRYLAMIVGALIAAIMFAAWQNRKSFDQSPALATGLAGAVIFQAALGAWTVTMLLKPAIVTSHLVGGITILVLLALLLARQPGSGKLGERIIASPPLKAFAAVATLVLFAQIVLGGWTSTNYAALACVDLPTCNGKLVPEMDFANALRQATGVSSGAESLTLTHAAHGSASPVDPPGLLYARHGQDSIDRNTVDLDRERASFVDNSVKYEATLRFINGSLRTMLDAMKSPSQG